jgi:hypothetical protein
VLLRESHPVTGWPYRSCCVVTLRGVEWSRPPSSSASFAKESLWGQDQSVQLLLAEGEQRLVLSEPRSSPHINDNSLSHKQFTRKPETAPVNLWLGDCRTTSYPPSNGILYLRKSPSDILSSRCMVISSLCRVGIERSPTVVTWQRATTPTTRYIRPSNIPRDDSFEIVHHAVSRNSREWGLAGERPRGLV